MQRAPLEILTEAQTVRRETFRNLASILESLHRCGQLSSGFSAVAALVCYLVKDGVSYRRLAIELSTHGFRRSPMWYQRAVARSRNLGGVGEVL